MTGRASGVECEYCKMRGDVQCRYERYDPETGAWHEYLFCCWRCCSDWLRQMGRLPDTGVITSNPR
jgi:hypothetical protein